ncbi:hypothetical protein [Mycobacterium interjectum]|uniref:hypothetical protein n=2 Tax=Mycobacterium interjectum TaxID=33895 RepID=UPI0021F34F88|nr:hypothetical protein [Mycobacterium interjectum]MCV7089355.1 hypothetical protein [Mycobacterium interjectum]
MVFDSRRLGPGNLFDKVVEAGVEADSVVLGHHAEMVRAVRVSASNSKRRNHRRQFDRLVPNLDTKRMLNLRGDLVPVEFFGAAFE